MKRTTTVLATALTFVLATGAMAGCGNQQASTTEPEATTEATESAETTEATAQTQEELIAEFKNAIANVPDCKSVTAEEESSSLFKDDDEAITSKSIYKFDESGEKLRTSSESEISGIKLTYYTEGDDAVLVTDGPAYSGTVEQFDLVQGKGLQAYLEDLIGAQGMLADCAASVEKTETNGLTFYTLTLDIDKYTAADEALQLLADSGSKLVETIVTIGFEEDGNIASIDRKYDFGTSTATRNVVFKDHNSTTVDPMPEATNTYEEMEADMETKLDEMFGGDEAADAAEQATDEQTTEPATDGQAAESEQTTK